MSTSSRLTPKQIKAWCRKTYWNMIDTSNKDERDIILDLMYKSYKRGYQDALSG